MSKLTPQEQLLTDHFFELVRDTEAAAPPDLDPTTAALLRDIVQVEQAASQPVTAPRSAQIWQGVVEEARKPALLPDVLEDNVRPLPVRHDWRLALVAGLMLTILAAGLVWLVLSQANSSPTETTQPTAIPKPPPPPTPNLTPTVPVITLLHPDAIPLSLNWGWPNNYPSGNVVEITNHMALAVPQPYKNVLNYYQQKLTGAGYEITSTRQLNQTDFSDGFVAYNQDSMIVVNVASLENARGTRSPRVYNLYKQMAGNQQTLVLYTEGKLPASLQKANKWPYPSSTALQFNRVDWPIFTAPFDRIEDLTLKPDWQGYASSDDFAKVVQYYKDTLKADGYEVGRDTSNNVNSCAVGCQMSGYNYFTASKDSTTVMVSTYSPSARTHFKPAEIARLKKEYNLQDNQTLVMIMQGEQVKYQSSPAVDPNSLSLAWSPDGKVLATTAGNQVVLWGNGRNFLSTLTDFAAPIQLLAWSPDSKILATASQQEIIIWSADGKRIATFNGHSTNVAKLAWSPDSTLLTSAGACYSGRPGCDTTPQIWSARGSRVATLQEHAGGASALVWSPDSKMLATNQFDGSANQGNTLRLWRPDGSLIMALPSLSSGEAGLKWSPDSKLLASGPDRGNIILWNAETSAPAGAVPVEVTNVFAMEWSPDGKFLAVGDTSTSASVWIRDSQLIRKLNDHRGPVRTLAWSPDGKFLATGTYDSSKLWDASGKLIADLPGHNGPVTSLLWSPNSTTLVSVGSSNRELFFWDTSGNLKFKDGMRLDIADPKLIGWSAANELAVMNRDGNVLIWDSRGYNVGQLSR